MATMQAKLDAQLRGPGWVLGRECVARRNVEAGGSGVKAMARPKGVALVGYGWRRTAREAQGRALQWWLSQLEQPTTRAALLERHQGV